MIGRTLASGSAIGLSCRVGAPLSFWGGVDPDGTISDSHHPQLGLDLSGRVLVMVSGRGSSSSSSVLAELIRAGAAPAAVVLAAPDAIIALGAIVASELYGIHLPVVTLAPDDFAALPDNVRLLVHADRHRATISQVGLGRASDLPDLGPSTR